VREFPLVSTDAAVTLSSANNAYILKHDKNPEEEGWEKTFPVDSF
jgi:hypothetical protein